MPRSVLLTALALLLTQTACTRDPVSPALPTGTLTYAPPELVGTWTLELRGAQPGWPDAFASIPWLDSVPAVVNRINNTFRRADEIQWSTGVDDGIDYFAPIIADAEAGFGGVLNAFGVADYRRRRGGFWWGS